MRQQLMSMTYVDASVELESEQLQQLEDFFEHAPVGLQLGDSDGTIRRSNVAQLELLGYFADSGEYEGHPFQDFFADPSQGRELIARALDGERLNNVEARLIRRGGEFVDVFLDVSARIDDGKARAIRWFTRPNRSEAFPNEVELWGAMSELGVGGLNPVAYGWEEAAPATRSRKDLTPIQRKMLLDELDDFFENGPAGVHFVGYNGHILRANKAELELLGYLDAPTEYVGHPVRNIHSNKAIVEELLRRLVEGLPVINFPARLIRKDGSLQPVIIYSGLRLKDGKFENTRCFLFEHHDPTGVEVPSITFNWPRNEEV
jgi:PAS domain S-box-containing protein